MSEILSEEELNFLLGKTVNANNPKSSKTEKSTHNDKNPATPQKSSDNSNKKSTSQSKNTVLTNEEKQFFADLFNTKPKKEKSGDDLER